MDSRFALTQAGLKAAVRYEPETGLFFWIKTRSNRRAAGLGAGAIGANGYRYITINKTPYLAGRLAWLFMTGQWPSEQVDHRDRDRSNNRWSNLRLATQSQNSANGSTRTTNTSGFKGVSWDRTRGLWFAKITVNYKQIALGRFQTPENAHAAYIAAASKYFGEFAAP